MPIYEVGELEGRHFFSMGLIDGQSLAGRIAGSPLAPRAAAELLLPVAEAIEYAHGKGVVHRDLKPGNILLDRDGRPRITDFGLAKKLSSDSGITVDGQIIGTPSYMAPEQARGDQASIGPPCDIYALGAVLYELLTGRPPFKGATLLETLELVRTEDPLPPSRLQPRLPKDIETICLRCLEKESAKRYSAAREVALELGRFLRDEPILARRPSRIERGWRWCRRNPLAAALSAAISLLAVGGPLVALREFELRGIADRATADAQENAKNARLALDAETKANATARAVVDKFITRVSEEGLLDQPGLQPVRQELLTEAAQYYRELISRRKNDPSAAFEMATAYARLGEITKDVSDLTLAKQYLDESLAIFESLAEKPADWRIAHAKTLVEAANVRHRLGESIEAQAIARQGVSLYQQALQEAVSDEKATLDLASAYQNLAFISSASSDLAGAMAASREGQKIAEPFLTSVTRGDEARRILAGNLQTLALALAADGELADALRHLQRAVDLNEEAVSRNPRLLSWRFELARNLMNQGSLRFQAGDNDGGDEAFEKSREILEALAAENPAMNEYQSQLGVLHQNQAMLLWRALERDEARRRMEMSFEIAGRLTKNNPRAPDYEAQWGVAWTQKAAMAASPADAIAAARESCRILEKITKGAPERVEYLRWLAAGYTNLGNKLENEDEKRAAFEKAIGALRVALAKTTRKNRSRQDFIPPYSGLRQLHFQRGDVRGFLDLIREMESDVALEVDECLMFATGAAAMSATAKEKFGNASKEYRESCRLAARLMRKAIEEGFPAAYMEGFLQGVPEFAIVQEDQVAKAELDRLQASSDRGKSPENLIRFYNCLIDSITAIDFEESNDELTSLVAVLHAELGRALLEAGDFFWARKHLQQSLDLSAASSLSPDDLARNQHDAADAAYRLGDSRAGLRLFRAELATLEKLPEQDGAEFRERKALCLNFCGSLARRAGEFKAAREYFDQAASMYEALLAADPDSVQHITNVASAWANMARLELQLFSAPQAKAKFDQAIELLLPLEEKQRLQPHHVYWLADFREYSALCGLAFQAIDHVELAAMQPVSRARWLFIWRAAVFARRGDDVAVADSIRRLQALPTNEPQQRWKDLACCYGRCAEMLSFDSTLLPAELANDASENTSVRLAEREAKRLEYLREGISALSKAIDEGLREGVWLQSTTDLLTLKTSPEYREIERRLDALREKRDAPRL